MIQHLSACGDCAREAEKACLFEDKLRSALLLDAPEGMASQASLGREAAQPRRRFAHRAWALAAVLLLGLGAAGWSNVAMFGDDAPLADLVLRHIQHESEMLLKDEQTPPGALAALLQPLGGKITSDIGKVRYAVRCLIRHEMGVHLVLAGERGPVTVLLMPGEHLASPRAVNAQGFSGILLPTDYGSMAVVGEQPEAYQQLAERVNNAVSWKI